MLFRHRHTGKDYRLLIEAFDVQEQRPSVVYVSIETGAVFVRDKEIFYKKFVMIGDPQSEIEPSNAKNSLQQQLTDTQGKTL